MKFAILLSAMTCLLLLNTRVSCGTYTSIDNFDYYNNRNHKITIGYPKTWSQVNSPGTIFAAVDERTARSINLVITEPEHRSLQNVTTANQRELKRNIPRVQKIQEDSGDIKNINYTVTEYRFYNPSISGNMFLAIYCFVENRKAYIITFSSLYDDRHLLKKEIGEIINTVTIK